MRIGIYINNKNIAGVDCSDLCAGNPGIGGTEYCILLLAQVYKKSFPNEEVILFSACNSMLPKVDGNIVIEDINELGSAAENYNVDMLVISAIHDGNPLTEEFLKEFENRNIKLILWGHNFYLSDFCNTVAKSKAVKANVFVGHQQYDRYIDHKIIKKSTYIYNMYPVNDNEVRHEIKDHSVTYIGYLVPSKGFHILASAWKEILKTVPDATLNVIGSGKLYGRNSVLGKYNISDKVYEDMFMSSITDSDGNILPSVKFWGVLGAEKTDVIKKTCVGVVNPSGKTETFGISALDFESMGVPVVTIAKGGFLDTVIDGETGLLYGNTDDLAKKVTALLLNGELNKKYGQAGIKLSQKFAPEKIIKEWDELFRCVAENRTLSYKKPTDFFNNNLKKYRIINRKIKDKIKIEYPISVIAVETVARKILRMLGK